jgi:hypothetical protein
MVGEELGTEFGLKAFNETAEHFIVLDLGDEHGCLAEGINVGGGRGSLSKGSQAVTGLKNGIVRGEGSHEASLELVEGGEGTAHGPVKGRSPKEGQGDADL